MSDSWVLMEEEGRERGMEGGKGEEKGEREGGVRERRERAEGGRRQRGEAGSCDSDPRAIFMISQSLLGIVHAPN